MRVSMAVEEALRAGDVDTVRWELDDPPDWPNSVEPYMRCSVLALALGVAPPAAIRRLLDEGADPNVRVLDDGFPALVDVVHHSRERQPPYRADPEAHEILAVLIAAGARVDERGLDDWTALHFAASYDDEVAVRLLLEAGADPNARTRIDDVETPVEVAEKAGAAGALAVLRAWPAP